MEITRNPLYGKIVTPVLDSTKSVSAAIIDIYNSSLQELEDGDVSIEVKLTDSNVAYLNLDSEFMSTYSSRVVLYAIGATLVMAVANFNDDIYKRNIATVLADLQQYIINK